jgi:catechol 2,3-dioxygenase-like lactoylglutathione lyase family enzyme
MRFHHMAILVSDIDIALRLWRDTLDFVVVEERDLPDGDVQRSDVLMPSDVFDDITGSRGSRSKLRVLRSNDGALIELMQMLNPPIRRTPPLQLRYNDTGIHELGLLVNNIDNWFARITSAGYSVQTKYIWHAANIARSFIFYDADGNMIQLWEYLPRGTRSEQNLVVTDS